MLLIYPPLAKSCEPPAGIALLAGALRGRAQPCLLLDANLEGQLHLLNKALPTSDTWSRRAHRSRAANLKALRSPALYAEPDRYRRALSDLNRVLGATGRAGLHLNLANYQDLSLSPLKSIDLLRAAEHPAKNIFHDYFAARLDGLLAEAAPPLVGFSINYLSQAPTAFAMIGYLRKIRPALPIAAGGGLITSWLSSPEWRDPFGGLIDHLIAGPGEAPLLEILTGLKAPTANRKVFRTGLPPGREAPARDSPAESLNNRRQGPAGGISNPIPITPPGECDRSRPGGPDSIPRQSAAEREPHIRPSGPDFTGLPWRDYLAPGPILPYAASGGCYWRKCSFCPESAEGNPYRQLPPQVVLAQLADLTAAVEPCLIHFLDNAISPALMHALIASPPGPAWYSFARAEPELTDPGFCRALRRSGCVMLKLGLESGDQSVLDAMDKGIDLARVSRTLANLEKAGIAAYVYLLFGTPAESGAEARRTLEFTVHHASAITFLNLAIFNMPRSTPEAAALAKDGAYEGDLSLYTDFVHPRGWDRRAIRQFLDKEFKRHPAVAPIIRRDPPFFTSNHAPFLLPGPA